MGESRQRGRPPHPDVLTPREWEVLGLLREGLTNRQIAERLSVSQEAAKYHVSQILSKLSVATREEAAAWVPDRAKPQAQRPAWASGLAVFSEFARRLSFFGKSVVITASLLIVAGVMVLGYAVARSNGETTEEHVFASPTSPVSPTASGVLVGTATPSDAPTPDDSRPITSPTAGVIDERIRDFGTQLIASLQAGDVDSVVSNTMIQPVSCGLGGLVLPPGCTSQDGTSNPAIYIGIFQSDGGHHAEEDEYRRTISEWATNLATESDEWGGPEPLVYAAGTFRSPIDDEGLVQLLVTRIAGHRPEGGGIPGPELTRQIMFFEIDAVADPIVIRGINLTSVNAFDSANEGSLESVASLLFSEWELWSPD